MEGDDKDRETFFAIHETRGEAMVRANLESHKWGTREGLVREWLKIREEERLTDAERLAHDALAAGIDAARAANESARWTKWAAVAAAAGAFATALGSGATFWQVMRQKDSKAVVVTVLAPGGAHTPPHAHRPNLEAPKAAPPTRPR